MSNANKPAFPSEPKSFAPPDSFGSGLSKREYFAVHLCASLFTTHAFMNEGHETPTIEVTAKAALQATDVLLAELERTK